ncbi:hypothetical protein L6164_010119 [Bauhinia variegata]|uniref:Uncharacterized protein n=1 Tax=Bauhinia variegata TaxID=167791 RepID=A0ACB9PL84_BAUVA|nr:hypothetical protein L6164_010119 [Bauhinia variegata]
MGASQSVSQKSLHDFTVKDARGKDVDLGIYKGKVLLVVNIASKCGFTDSNYTQLAELHNRYRDKGFEILAFPCNQFLKQEPGTSQDAQEFACTRYKAEYPIFGKLTFRFQVYIANNCKPRFLGYKEKVEENLLLFALASKIPSLFANGDIIILLVRVNGPDTAPVYKFLKAKKSGLWGARIKWNFTKFLVDREGHVMERFSTTTPPLAIENDIKKALRES